MHRAPTLTYPAPNLAPFDLYYFQGISPDTEFSTEATARIKTSIEARYKLLPYLYSQFYLSHTVGAMVVKPLFFDYLDDNSTLDIVSQFMLGDAIMVTPVTVKVSTLQAPIRTLYLGHVTGYQPIRDQYC